MRAPAEIRADLVNVDREGRPWPQVERRLAGDVPDLLERLEAVGAVLAEDGCYCQDALVEVLVEGLCTNCRIARALRGEEPA